MGKRQKVPEGQKSKAGWWRHEATKGLRRPPQRRRKMIGSGEGSSCDEWRRSTKKVVGNRVESRRARERTVALLVGDREAVPPRPASGPTGSHRLSPEARVAPFPQLEKAGGAKAGGRVEKGGRQGGLDSEVQGGGSSGKEESQRQRQGRKKERKKGKKLPAPDA